MILFSISNNYAINWHVSVQLITDKRSHPTAIGKPSSCMINRDPRMAFSAVYFCCQFINVTQISLVGTALIARFMISWRAFRITKPFISQSSTRPDCWSSQDERENKKAIKVSISEIAATALYCCVAERISTEADKCLTILWYNVVLMICRDFVCGWGEGAYWNAINVIYMLFINLRSPIYSQMRFFSCFQCKLIFELQIYSRCTRKFNSK